MITYPVRYHVSRLPLVLVRVTAVCALGVVGVSLGTTFLFAAFVVFACVTLPMMTASQLRWSTRLLAYEASLVDGHLPASCPLLLVGTLCDHCRHGRSRARSSSTADSTVGNTCSRPISSR
jgi:hypothetical protein